MREVTAVKTLRTPSFNRGRFAILVSALIVTLTTAASAQVPLPTFDKAFQPSTIGPGSVSTLRFDLTNPDAVNGVTDLAFVDNLPLGVTIADPANASTDCADAVLAAPDGGGTISFSGGRLVPSASCVVLVDVTSSTPSVHMNVTGDLTSSAGNSGTASADLTVVTDRPGFSKSFAPSTVPLGDRSTLIFTIDNTANPAARFLLRFTDNLPTGLEVADPAAASNGCTGGILTAIPGTSVISLSIASPGPSVAALSSCTVSVDVVATGFGLLDNITGELTSSDGFTTSSSGKASATLEVTAGRIALIKEFTDDPVPAGGTVTLEFTLVNRDRDFAATDIAFDDDLNAALAGLTATALPPMGFCGAGSQLTGAGMLSLTGASLPPEGICTFSATLQVPAAAATGVYPNVTTAVTATIDGAMVTGNAASDDLFVEPSPVLTKEFLGDPVGGGDSVVIEFTVENASTTSSATDIAFLDELTTFFPFPVSVTLPAAGFCGPGASMALISFGTDRQGLSMTGGSLGPSAMCTFQVTLDVPVGMPSGFYLNTTDVITATVDGATVTGSPASDALEIAGGPSLIKEFTDDPVVPGGTATLEFTLTHEPGASADATGIGFTDNLDAVLSGLVATGLPMNNICGAGSQIDGTMTLTFTGGSLMPGESCTFSVTLQVPGVAAAGSHTNTTSSVTATVAGVPVIENAASGDLRIAGLTITKEFLNDPVQAGGTVDLQFTVDNISPVDDATAITFTDNLNAALPGLAVVPASLPVDPCGAGSQVTGTTSVTFTGGILDAGEMCQFTLTLDVPAAAASGSYINTTSSLTANVGGSPVTFDPAVDTLVVAGDLLFLAKEFTDDPVAPGDTVTLEFTLTNLDPAQSATGIAFTDDLDAALSGLAAVGLPAVGICGAGSQIIGTDLLTFTGGSLAPGASCVFSVTVQVPAGLAFGATVVNTTSSVTGTVGGLGATGDPASAELQIDFLTLSKAFDGPSTATGMPTLTFTISNLNAGSPVTDISFSDDLDAVISGLVAVAPLPADPCGAGSALAGTGFLTLSGGSLAAGGSCAFAVTLLVPASATAGSFLNTTSDLLQAGLPIGVPATDTLVIEPPPTFAKSFAPAAIGIGLPSTLTFTVDNTASAVAAGALAFTDNLPAGVEVASPPNASTGCGGTLTAVAASGVITLTGGSVGAGASCTAQVDVTGTVAGMHVNTTGALTSTSGVSGTASDTLTVNPQPLFAKSFAPDPIDVGLTSTLTFTIDNTASTVAATGLDFTDNLPAAVVVATPANIVDSCGGTPTAVSGTGVITYSGGSVAAGASCTVQADVTSAIAGIHVNTTGDLTSSLGNSGTAGDTLTVQIDPLGFSKLFVPDLIQAGGISTLTFTIDNPANAVAVGNLAFTDNLPAAVSVANPAAVLVTCTGGTVTAVPGTGVISYSGGSVPAGTSCTVSVEVTSSTVGLHANVSGDLTSDAGTAGPATDDLLVADEIGFVKSFIVGPVLPGGTVLLEYTITNNKASLGLTDIAFTDDLGAALPGLAAVGLPAADVCGAGSQLAGTTLLTLTGGNLPPGASCTFSATLLVPADALAGLYPSTSGAITGMLGAEVVQGPPAVADLEVVFLEFSKAFAAGVVPAGTTTMLAFTITNPDPTNGATGITFTDDLDAALPGLEAIDLPQADVCGAGSLLDGTSLISLTGGSLGPSETCTFEVTLQVPQSAPSGDFTNVTGVLEAVVGGAPVVGSPADVATAVLSVEASLLEIPALSAWGLLLLALALALLAVGRLRLR